MRESRCECGYPHATDSSDGTLLVQRFHHRDNNLESRHLLGLYRTVNELRSVQALPIVVFDHLTARVPEKAREQSRRREVRTLSKARLALERARQARLAELELCFATYESLCEAEQHKVSAYIREAAQAAPRVDDSGDDTVVKDVQLGNDSITLVSGKAALRQNRDHDPAGQAVIDWADEMASKWDSEMEDNSWDGAEVERGTVSTGDIPADESENDFNLMSSRECEWYPLDAAEIRNIGAPTSEALAQRISELRFMWFKMAKCEATAGAETLQKSTDAQQARETSSQLRLTLAEEHLYTALEERSLDEHGAVRVADTAYSATSSANTPVQPCSTTYPHLIAWMRECSTRTIRSLTRATSTIPPRIYEEATYLCRLMGVPVFAVGNDTDGSDLHEGEAYCCSLVRNGYADVVASEDSDVLVYDVPLLRGLAAGPGHYEVVHSRTLRHKLFQPKDASEPADRRSYEAMLQFALLCGTDFNRTVRGIGAVRAHRLVLEHGNIPTILDKYASKYKPPDGLSRSEYLAELARAYALFTTLPDLSVAARRQGLQQRFTSLLGSDGSGPQWARILGIDAKRLLPPVVRRFDERYVRNFLVHQGIPRYSLGETSEAVRVTSFLDVHPWRETAAV